MLGRTVRTVYPDGSEALWFYEMGGRFIRGVDTDGIETLCHYDPDGSFALTVVDMDRDDEVDGAGPGGRRARKHSSWLESHGPLEPTGPAEKRSRP
ncbi:MAG: hypothetical protein KatS3mg132_690 [Limisphaera sp.]|nr:MAG: hypothetical protein KatS3mg132_690 [Limisphaera sp.]